VILLFVAILMVLLPTSGILLAYLFGSPPSILLGGALLGFPALPAVYFYIIYRRQLGKSEIRANSLITQYLFVILMFTLAIAVIPFVLSLADYAGEEVVVGVGALLSGGLLTVFTYGPFSQFVRRKILGIPMQPEEVMQKLTSEITSKLSTKELATFLEESIVPTFLIKQSGLFYYRDRQMVESFYAAGVNKSQYPKTGDADNLIAHSNRYLVDGADTGLSDSLSWVRLALPLYEGEELIAFWLLGKRDPDDFYAQAEISSFRFLADQCAIALANIEQTKQLRALYQSNVTREEGERESLARDLHDVVLNELGLAQLDIEDKATAAKLKEINNFIRDTITGLRPPAISQGLYWGLAELCEELNARGDEHPTLVLEMPISMQRYDQDVELHSFRIVQQACENAFRHAEAKEVVINGSLESDNIQLWVEDDGRGFDDAGVDLSKLLENKHYGLASIVERANLIEADVRFGPGNVSGAKVSLAWVKQSS
jgi:signal transduction histidine kinase